MKARLYRYRSIRAETDRLQSIGFLSKSEAIGCLSEVGKEPVDSDKLHGLQMTGAG